MTMTTEQRRTIEARLDRLKERLRFALANDAYTNQRATVAVLKGTLDLLSDVLLAENDHG